MEVHRERFLLFFAAIAACHDAEHGPAKSAGAVTIAPLPPPPTPPAPTPCAAVIANNQRILATPTNECVKSDDGDDRDRDEEAGRVRAGLVAKRKAPLFNYCHEGHGTWMVEIASAKVTAPTGESNSCAAEVTYQVVFAKAGEAKLATKPRSWESSPDDDVSSKVFSQIDLDGDGRDELVIVNKAFYNGGGGDASVDVLQSTGGAALRPYPVGFPFDDVTDADGDGRPDLVNTAYFHVANPCMGLYETYRSGVPLLVHSLPDGKFTMSDDVSRKWARSKCPSLPAAAELPDEGE
jgi:hypothetical protein